MNDTGYMILLFIFGFGGLLSIIIYKKLQSTFGAKRAIRYFLLTTLSLLIIVFLLWNFVFRICPNCGCDNVDDCLSKLKFEEARKYAANETPGFRPDAFYKIIVAETQYWISQNELDRAKNTLKELLSLENGMNGNETERKEKFSELNNNIIIKYCEKKQFDEAQKIVHELPDKIAFKKKEYISQNDGKDKYNSLKKGLKSNQEIEEWKGTSEYYEIFTYKYPVKEAMKIIEEYKKGNN